jgi:acyl-CoA thioesterase
MSRPEPDLAAVRAGWESQRCGYSLTLGITLDTLQPGRATMRMPVTQAIMNEVNAVHGGAIASLCDTAFHLAHLSLYGLDEPAVTVDLMCTFLNAAYPPHDLIAHSKIIKGGKRIIYGEVSVYSNDRIVAHATLNFMNLNADRR